MDTLLAALGIAVSIMVSTSTADADSAADVRSRLAEMPRPWTEKAHRITREEYEETLRFWAERHLDRLTVEEVDQSVGGMGIFLIRVTDTDVSDADKQVCFITSLHGGPERSGTTAALHLIEWLIGDDPLAVETRQRQIVLAIPIVNPES
ncbi:MAG: zinc carboxypeptidase, partial [bacterium]|nr:zinc carboxypeptidase [bacterium]